MKKLFSTSFLIIFTCVLHAQVSLSNIGIESPPSLCKPGVVNKAPGKGAAFTYTFNPDYKMRAPEAEKPVKVRRNERFDTKLKVPLIHQPKFSFMLGFQYTLERYHFLSIIPENYPLFKRLNETDLKTASVSAYVIRPLNHKLYTSFRVSASWHGDYDKFVSFDNRYAIYRVAGLIGLKKNDYVEYGVGLMFNKGFRNTRLLPFGFYNRTFNDHWGIEAAIPVSIKGRYNFSPRTLILFGSEYSSQNYALKVKEPSMNPFQPQPEKAPYHYHRSSVDLTASLYQQLSGWTWIEFKAGYAFNLNSQARDLPARQNYDLQPSGSLLGQISFFVSPPRGKGD
jgi:hypothetical protein